MKLLELFYVYLGLFYKVQYVYITVTPKECLSIEFRILLKMSHLSMVLLLKSYYFESV